MGIGKRSSNAVEKVVKLSKKAFDVTREQTEKLLGEGQDQARRAAEMASPIAKEGLMQSRTQ